MKALNQIYIIFNVINVSINKLVVFPSNIPYSMYHFNLILTSSFFIAYKNTFVKFYSTKKESCDSFFWCDHRDSNPKPSRP